MTDDELLALAKKAIDQSDPYRPFECATTPSDIIALIERHRAEVERLTRERDEQKFQADQQAERATAVESALAAAQKRVGVLQNVAGETLAALDKLDPLQAVLPVQQANLRAALAGGTAGDGG